MKVGQGKNRRDSSAGCVQLIEHSSARKWQLLIISSGRLLDVL
ncbi:MAG: hypothetical protein OFPII_16270 [Osedax symbiont Rs1]|nr:MAG: hypothetical protein OFPII_16270 [Osedax symbiont Rs1]